MMTRVMLETIWTAACSGMATNGVSPTTSMMASKNVPPAMPMVAEMVAPKKPEIVNIIHICVNSMG